MFSKLPEAAQLVHAQLALAPSGPRVWALHSGLCRITDW